MKKFELILIIFLSFTSGYSFSLMLNDKYEIKESFAHLNDQSPHEIDPVFKKKFDREINSFAPGKIDNSDFTITSEQDLIKKKKELDLRLAELEKKLVLLEPNHEGKN